jgi:hypothetical protein
MWLIETLLGEAFLILMQEWCQLCSRASVQTNSSAAKRSSEMQLNLDSGQQRVMQAPAACVVHSSCGTTRRTHGECSPAATVHDAD